MNISNEKSELQGSIYIMNLFLLKCLYFYEKHYESPSDGFMDSFLFSFLCTF